MTNDLFHYFSYLPLELRRMIWMHCLPHRIAEEDSPDYWFDGYESKQVCWARRLEFQNSQPPVIAFVNSESRQVALEQGHLLELPYEITLRESKKIWVQPRRDVLHYNWTRMWYAIQGVDSDGPGSVDEFLLHAKDLGMRPSVTAELIYTFSLKQVLECDGDVDELCRENPLHFGMWAIPKILYHGRGEAADDVREMVDLLPWAKDQRSRLDITMAGVSLHITSEVALKSGLFGLLGDAPVQMVDVDDEARVREFQALYREHAFEKEPVVQTLFETFTSRGNMEKKAEWTILAYMWQSARERKLDILGTNPGSAWLPNLSEQKDIYMDEHLPNEQHPWVKHARQLAPQLRLRIKVHYCTNQCYIKERLPKGAAFEGR
ncbi:hypothetical protein N7517_009767 [Penicillium concentricum]|uniref:2EXR domain-containing protein n=1 Tax=Penicillium concentricum TaxID=293559 RepID=A0A9W9RIB9_9EURO|nr:uncharacterized protein N7517_009767 [Penicillium concentricum]KAJ5360576.1 hypothetical protein N7517_009767 [Penicillium concentricum]